MMKTRQGTTDYEALRTWALHPSSMRPSGLAHLLRGGFVTWMCHSPPLPAAQSSETHTARLFSTPLSTLVAAMIAEVYR
jgi:hypothetical protein